MSAVPQVLRVSLPIRTEEELRYFVGQAFGVALPDVQACPHHVTPWRIFSDIYFGKNPITVIKASRGSGKSFLLSLIGVMLGATIGADVNVLGASGEQAKRVHGHMQGFWRYPNSPRYILDGEPTQTEMQMQWGNTIKALMASQASVRGPHPQVVIIDEADECTEDIFEAALGQAQSNRGIEQQTIISSTEQYAGGLMAKIRKRAKDHGWAWYEFCYKEVLEPHGWLSARDIAIKRSLVSAAMWETEYELQLPDPGSLAINTAAVEKMFRKELGVYKGAPGEYLEFEMPAMDDKGEMIGAYSTGADWARKKDWTVIWTWRLDCNPRRLVAFERLGREPWPAMVARFEERCNRYPGEAAHDGTGIGDVVDGFMNVKADSFMMVGRARYDMLSNYIAAVERGEYEAPMIGWCYESHKNATRDDIYKSTGETERHHLPDDICAAALAHYAQDSAIQIGSL